MDWGHDWNVFGQPLSGHDEAVDDEDEDFYDEAQAQTVKTEEPVQVNPVEQPAQPTPEQIKLENQKRTEALRARLMANRQNTPSKTTPRPESISAVQQPLEGAPLQSTHVNMTMNQRQTPAATAKATEQDANNDLLEALREGKAAADARTAELAAAGAVTTNQQSQTNNGIAQSKKDAKQECTIVPTPAQQPVRPTILTDSYYDDLAQWLEMTGYHNVEYRASKLRTHKERRALEQEAARIAERLKMLRETEQTEIQSLRAAPAMQPCAGPAPPELPAALPDAKLTIPSNGTKRAHSPDASHDRVNRRREGDNGFRIRGANDSPSDTRAGSIRRPRSPDLAYGGTRRRSGDSFRYPRDASLERRQSYYRHDAEPPFEPRTPRVFPQPRPARQASQSYRGSAALDLRKGVRYFIIKSWNLENIETAQRENVWATQEKNEQLLTDAFKSCRHVLLLFSANKSMAFQGYAIMTSPPDPELPKPSFCAKLNWSTSPAFTIRWFATTPVHFRFVGHLKNTLNMDDRGEPRAVLVGKDGQEISEEAGKGLVWILDDWEANERGGK